MNNDIPNIASFRGNASFPPWHQDYIPTAQEWLNCFSNKADAYDLDALRKTISPHNHADENENENLYDRLLSLEKNGKDLSQTLTSFLASFSLPTTILGTTLDNVGPDFEAREQASLMTKLTAQLSWASQQQQRARDIQLMIVTAQQKGLYP